MPRITLSLLASLAESFIRTMGARTEIVNPILLFTSDGETVGSAFFRGESDAFNADVARMLCHAEQATAAVLIFEARGAEFGPEEMAEYPGLRLVAEGLAPASVVPERFWRDFVVVIGDDEAGARLNRAFLTEGSTKDGRRFIPKEDVYDRKQAPHWPMVNTHDHDTQAATLVSMLLDKNRIGLIRKLDPADMEREWVALSQEVASS